MTDNPASTDSEQTDSAATRRTRVKIAVAVAVVIALAVVATVVDLPDPNAIRDTVASAGAWGIAAFVLLYAALSATPFPASALTIAAGLLFGLATGATLVVVAATIGAYLAYWAARGLGRGAVASAQWSRLRTLDEMLGRRGFVSVFVVRLIPVFPFWLVNYAAGVSAVKQRDYVLGTAIGIVPGTVGYTALGAYGTSPLSWPFAAAVAAVLLLSALSTLLARRLGPTKSADTEPDAAPDSDARESR